MFGRSRVSERSSGFRILAACIIVTNARQRNAMPADAFLANDSVHQSGDRAGNWLTREQARLARSARDRNHRRKRDRAILAVLLGCALRRSELAALESRHIQPSAT